MGAIDAKSDSASIGVGQLTWESYGEFTGGRPQSKTAGKSSQNRQHLVMRAKRRVDKGDELFIQYFDGNYSKHGTASLTS